MKVNILLAHGQTPSGFGLALVGKEAPGFGELVWYMRPLSPCCGDFIEMAGYDDDLCCRLCGTSWQTFADTCSGTIGNDVPLTEGFDDSGAYSRWFARIMELPNAEKNHGVELSIEWT